MPTPQKTEDEKTADPDLPTFNDIKTPLPFWVRFLMVFVSISLFVFGLVAYAVFTARMIEWYGGFGLVAGLAPMIVVLSLLIALAFNEEKKMKAKNTA